MAVPEPPRQRHSTVALTDGDHRRLRWTAGADCPPALHQAAAQRTDEQGHLRPDDDEALPTLLQCAAEAGHRLQVDAAVWLHLARHRDARRRLFELESAHPQGPASAALQTLLRAPLAPFQAEGALFAACAGRALIADERGLGKTVQALAAAALLQRHAGVQRVLVRCTAARHLSWQREAARFLPDGTLDWRIAGDGIEAAAPQAWSPDLVVIDEPAQLQGWDRVDAPFALVLCGTPLETAPALLDALVDFLDRDRQGPLAHWRTVRAIDADPAAAAEAAEAALQPLMLLRSRAEVADQLPPQVMSERVLPLAPAQRAAHDAAATQAAAIVAGWRRRGRLSDAEQWQLGSALNAMRAACHRADPARADGPLADGTLDALAQLAAELLHHPELRIAVLADSPEDALALQQRLSGAGLDTARLPVVAGGPALPDADVVLRIGVPWCPPRPDGRPRQWIHLVADASIDSALFDTLALRDGVPSSPAEGGHEGFLHGARLKRYLLAAEAALQSIAGPRAVG